MPASKVNSRIMKLFFVLPLVVYLLSNIPVITCCFDHERAALLSFKSHLIDPSDRLSSWQGRNCCSWSGIRCSRLFHVVAIDLRNRNPDSFMKGMNSKIVPTSNSTSTALIGKISSSLFTLTYIKHLDLSFNNFMLSKIPTGISNLTRLTYLNLSNAYFNDAITTQFANLTALEWLDLSCSSTVVDLSQIGYNLSASSSSVVQVSSDTSYDSAGFLSSSNLDWLKGKHNLRELGLSGVDLSEASKSALWANPLSVLSNLRSLQLSNCQISGEIPINQLLNLTHLLVLKLDFNSFTSRIPEGFSNLTSLSVLDLSTSNLRGQIPWLGQVRELYVGNNYITVDLHLILSHPWRRLETLDIRSTQVVGSIPPSLGNITSLVNFEAYNCFIQGSIPSSITNLSRLETLQLDFNHLVGHIPSSISNMKSLGVLSLMGNQLEGSIPNSVCNMSSLMFLFLQENYLTGTLPECIGHIPNLVALLVGINNLSGTIQLSASVLRSSILYFSVGFNNLTVTIDQEPLPFNSTLQMLDLSTCQVDGRIPDFLSNMTQLKLLRLVGNNLSGTIPSWLLNLPQLSYLDLSFNKLEGFLPPGIRLSPLSGLTTVLNLAGNQLQGSIPSVFENIEAINLSSNNFTGSLPPNIRLESARYFSISGNKLSGHIPAPFCKNRSYLELLDLSDNILSGPISLGNCTSLKFLNIGQNNFVGQVAMELQNAKNLSYLDLSNNQFEGPFPSFIEKLESLSILNIGNNKFSGKMPTFIGQLDKLQILVLRYNAFNESIPRELNKLQQLQFLDLSSNRFIGPIPEQLDGLALLSTQTKDDLIAYIVSNIFAGVTVKMTIKGHVYEYLKFHEYNTGMDLSLNALTGNIPPKITLLKGLTMLNLSYNYLSGKIPSDIGEMKGLQSLDLKFNNLSGKIPESMNLLDSLGALNLSFNNFSGTMPTGRKMDTFDDDNGSRYIGNKYLCGAPGAINCNVPSASAPDQELTSTEEDGTYKPILIGIVIVGYSVGLWGYFGVLYMLKEQWRERYWKTIDRIALRIMRFMHMNV